MIRSVVAALTALIVLAPAAQAATPATGTVSKASPTVSWTGAVTGSYANRLPVAVAEDDSFPCLPQSCDSFTLEVAESDDLTIKAGAPEGTSTGGEEAPPQVTLRIRMPDGSASVHTGDAPPDKPLTVQIKKAPAGSYTIEYFNNFIDGPIDYSASATLGKPAAAVVTPPAINTPPAPAPAPVQEAITVDVKAGKLSAKKLNKSRKLAATVTVSRAVKSVTVTLKSGSKVVGKGTLSNVSGSKKVTLKLSKKLKKGTYALSVAASDGAAAATKTIKVKVAK